MQRDASGKIKFTPNLSVQFETQVIISNLMHSDIQLNPRVGVLDMALLSPDIGVGIIISLNNYDLDFTQVVQCSTECIPHDFYPMY